MREFDALAEEVRVGFERACEDIAGRGYDGVERLARAMRHGIERRAAFRFDEGNRICIA